MDHHKAAHQICAAQRDRLLLELEKVGKHPECTEAVWKAILGAMNAAREAAHAKEKEVRAASLPNASGEPRPPANS